MKRSLYLHIGTEKTGTTSIQELLFQNRQVLSSYGYHVLQCAGIKNSRAVASYCLDDIKNDDYFMQHNISNFEERKKFKQNIYSALSQEIKGLDESIHSVIISSEHFHSRTNSLQEIRSVYDLLMPYFSVAKIICYLREQSATCESLYTTAILVGRRSPKFENFANSCNANNIYYNYYEMLNNWSEVFGIENISVREFTRDAFLNGNLLQDFISLIDIKLINLLNIDFDKQNVSLNYYGQIIGKALNISLPKSHHSPLIPNRSAAFEILCNNFKGKGKSMSPKIAKRIYDEFYESNRLVNIKYFGRDENLFAYKSPDQNCNVSEESFILGLADVLSKLFDIKVNLPDRYAVLFRDTALIMEGVDVEKAMRLMELASSIRPNGQIIANKLEEYKQKLIVSAE